MDNIVEQARALAQEVLKDETRYDGSPFLTHPDNVARIVEDEIGLPDACVAAVYLHEATRVHKEVDISAFPQDVRTLVDGLNKISTIKPKDTRLEAENYKRLIVQYSTDPRVTVLKIADRLEVMRGLQMFPKTSRDQKLLETLMLYMPLAHQLGLYNINNELGNIWFRYADPEQYRAITNKLKATEKDREQITAEFIEPLKRKLSDAGIVYKLKIRTKSAYSIYRKMQVQKVPFEGVYDVFAIRFIIDSISIVLILLAHFDEKWREDNQEFIGTLNGPLWEMRLSSEKRNMFDMKLQRVMAFNPICGGIYNSLCSGTDIDYIIPFDEFDPRKEVIAQKEKTEQIAVEASSENSKKLEMQNTRIEQLKKEIEELKEENETLGLAIEGYKSQGKGISAPEAAMLVTAVCDALNQLPANGRETLWPILSTCWGFTEKTAKDALRRKVTEEKASKLAGKFAVHNLVPRICNLLKELHEKLAEKKKERLLEVNPKVKK